MYKLLQDSLNLRKMNFIGAKIKVYQERLARTSPNKILKLFKNKDRLQDEDLEKKQTKKLAKYFDESDMVRKKIQINMVNKYEYYKQAHHKMNKMSSITLGVMTSQIYQLTDVYNMASCLVKYLVPVQKQEMQMVEITGDVETLTD